MIPERFSQIKWPNISNKWTLWIVTNLYLILITIFWKLWKNLLAFFFGRRHSHPLIYNCGTKWGAIWVQLLVRTLWNSCYEWPSQSTDLQAVFPKNCIFFMIFLMFDRTCQMMVMITAKIARIANLGFPGVLYTRCKPNQCCVISSVLDIPAHREYHYSYSLVWCFRPTWMFLLARYHILLHICTLVNGRESRHAVIYKLAILLGERKREKGRKKIMLVHLAKTNSIT